MLRRKKISSAMIPATKSVKPATEASLTMAVGRRT
jgi:hypothetical protein